MGGFSAYLDVLPESFKSVMGSIAALLAGETLLTPKSSKKTKEAFTNVGLKCSW